MRHRHEMVQRFLARADAVWPGAYAAVLHGSAVRGDFLEGRSDLNLLVVTPGLSPADLKQLAPALAPFEAEQLPPPLLLPRAEWSKAADAFPVEITDIKASYRVVRGEDPLAGLEVAPSDLRRALEAELRGKLLRLRVDFGLYHADERRLAAVVGHSIGPVRILTRAAVLLAGAPVPPDDAALTAAAAHLMSVEAAPLERLLAHRRRTDWRCPDHLFESYLALVEAVTRFVDHLHPGDADA